MIHCLLHSRRVSLKARCAVSTSMERTLCAMVFLLGVALASQVHGRALRPPAPQPSWKVGDSWTIRTWYTRTRLGSPKGRAKVVAKSRPVDITFEVSRLVSTVEFSIPYLENGVVRAQYGGPNLPVEGYKCFEIKVTFPPRDSGFQERYSIYFRQDMGNLIRVSDNSGVKGGPARDAPWDFPPEPSGPINQVHISSAIPFEFPDFTRDPNFSCEKRYGPKKDRKDIISQKITGHTVKSEDKTEHEEYEVVITTERPGYEWRVVQKWRKDDPWWYEARRGKNGRPQDYEAVLVRQKADEQ
jgi:hypothetical protein